MVVRREYPSAESELFVAVAMGVVDPNLVPPDPYAGERFNGHVFLTDRAIYFIYGSGSRSRVERLAKEDLRDWKHAERDGMVGIEFSTEDQRVAAMLHRSGESDPDALVEFGRRVEDADLLVDGVLAYTVVFDWEKRQAPNGEEYAQAAAETVARVRDADPGVFINIAGQFSGIVIDERTYLSQNDGMDRFADNAVRASGYVEARARILES